MTNPLPNALAALLRGFFTEDLPLVRGLARNTLLGYRDSMVLFLRFLATLRTRPVIALDLEDVDRDAVLAFLDHLEKDRGNKASTRNARLAALRSFARYAAGRAPEHVAMLQQIRSVPRKRAPTPAVDYLEGLEFDAMLDAMDAATPHRIRDHAMVLTLLNTGARVQEFLNIRPIDLQLDRPLQVRLVGKGRKERICPIWSRTAVALEKLLAERHLDPESRDQLFCNYRGEPLTRFGVRYILKKYASLAALEVPTISRKRVHPHVMRHTAAVHLLQSGVDLVTISHWLGHARIETTNRYTKVDLEAKRDAIARADLPGPADDEIAIWKSDVSILTWLEAL